MIDIDWLLSASWATAKMLDGDALQPTEAQLFITPDNHADDKLSLRNMNVEADRISVTFIEWKLCNFFSMYILF